MRPPLTAAGDTLDYRVLWQDVDVSGHANWQIEVLDLRWAKDWAVQAYPPAGRETIITDQHGAVLANGKRTTEDLSTNLVIAFNGTRWADLTVEGRYHFTLDLDTGDVEALPT